VRSSRVKREAAERAAAEAARRVDALEAEYGLLESALEALPLGVAVCDDSGAVIYRNQRVVELAEARHSEALASRALEEVLQGVRSQAPQSVTLDLRGPPPRTIVIRSHPLLDCPVPGAVAVVEDVTERRQLDAVRRDFVANVSHELRTPIGALAVLAETLAAEDDPASARRLAEHILIETERAAQIIEDLLDLSRIEAHAGDGHEEVPVDTVLGLAAARVGPAASRHGVELVLPTALEGVAVIGDRTQLVSAISNLLDNAVKYSDPGSTVEIEVRAGSHSTDIAVRDRGVGIPARDLSRIFERFYRVDRARSRQTGGTGLGLAIVRHVATNHGGEVLVESREGEGSTFTLRLPPTESTSAP
jgi:two-component system sensor histidine kinase SenX3